MGFDDLLLLQKMLAALLVGYLLGSVPFAHLAGRLRGVDIFATGNRRAGTANVFWNVGRRTGMVVFAGDVAKGSLTVIIGSLLDLPGPMLILAGGASILGHWKSVFTGFKGGDGMATLLGVSITVLPLLALIGIVAGVITVALTWKTPYRSAMGVGVCFTLMLGIGIFFPQHPLDLILGLVALAILVVTHNILIRRRLATSGTLPRDDIDDLEMDLTLGSEDSPDSDVGPSNPENC